MDLITGATGFIGGRLANRLESENRQYRLLVRTPHPCSSNVPVIVADFNDTNALTKACDGVETVYHCAGCAHAFHTLSEHQAQLTWHTNCTLTEKLVEIAGRVGVQKFVYASSVKAMAAPGHRRVDEWYPGKPIDAYGQSKRAAEHAVLKAGHRYGMHSVNLRLAMVYGAGGRGNLERMGRLVRRGLFPPLPETGNHRSLVHIDDVISAMRLVAERDIANGKTYIIAGPEAPSGRQLYDAMREALGLRRCRWAVPEIILRCAASSGDALGRLFKRRFPFDSEILERLLGSAWYSPDRIAEELGWRAKIPLHVGLREMFAC